MYTRILLVISLLLNTLSFSQNSYPQEIQYEGDSVVAFTKKQVADMNDSIVSLIGCNAEHEELIYQVNDLKQITNFYVEQAQLSQTKTEQLEKIVITGQEKFELCANEIELKDIQIRRQKIVQIGLAALDVILLV